MHRERRRRGKAAVHAGKAIMTMEKAVVGKERGGSAVKEAVVKYEMRQ